MKSIRALVVSAGEAGQSVAALLRFRLEVSWSEAKRLVHEQRVLVNGVACPNSAKRVKRGQRIDVRLAAEQVPSTAEPLISFADAHIVVVQKPAGLTTMRHPEEAAEFGSRARRFLPPTLADLLPALLAGGRPGRLPRVRAVHRLDKETSGLVVFARTLEAERHLGRQLRAHTMERRYLAIVRGEAKPRRIESWLVRDRGDGRRGSTIEAGSGQRAVTHVKVIERLGDYTLVECRLETGRTHQVRIHLAESGTPLCGEAIYDRPLHGKPITDKSRAPRMALHAASLGVQHPASGQHMTWEAPLPKDLANFLARLRRQAKSE